MNKKILTRIKRIFEKWPEDFSLKQEGEFNYVILKHRNYKDVIVLFNIEDGKLAVTVVSNESNIDEKNIKAALAKILWVGNV